MPHARTVQPSAIIWYAKTPYAPSCLFNFVVLFPAFYVYAENETAREEKRKYCKRGPLTFARCWTVPAPSQALKACEVTYSPLEEEKKAGKGAIPRKGKQGQENTKKNPVGRQIFFRRFFSFFIFLFRGSNKEEDAFQSMAGVFLLAHHTIIPSFIMVC